MKEILGTAQSHNSESKLNSMKGMYSHKRLLDLYKPFNADKPSNFD